MDEIIKILHEGDYSCVIKNGNEVKTYTKRGVSDLFELCESKDNFLNGAIIADKVVGKGAAALMIKGGIKSVYADTISSPAIELLHAHNIETDFREETSRIMNRRKDGLCPVETLCLNLLSIEEMYKAIYEFINNFK